MVCNRLFDPSWTSQCFKLDLPYCPKGTRRGQANDLEGIQGSQYYFRASLSVDSFGRQSCHSSWKRKDGSQSRGRFLLCMCARGELCCRSCYPQTASGGSREHYSHHAVLGGLLIGYSKTFQKLLCVLPIHGNTCLFGRFRKNSLSHFTSD